MIYLWVRELLSVWLIGYVVVRRPSGSWEDWRRLNMMKCLGGKPFIRLFISHWANGYYEGIYEVYNVIGFKELGVFL